MVFNIISKDKRNCLAFFNTDASHEALAVDPRALLLSKGYERTTGFVLTLLNCNVKLQLSILAMERGNFTLIISREVLFLEESGLVLISSIVERRKYFDI
jgi:hypothetical protein